MPLRSARFHALLVLCALLALPIAKMEAAPGKKPRPGGDKPPRSTEAEMARVNGAFLKQYGLNRAEAADELLMVIVIKPGEITWRTGGEPERIEVPLTRYTQAKSALHAVLGVHGMSSRLIRNGASEEEWKQAIALRGNIDRAETVLNRTRLSFEDQSRIRFVLRSLHSSLSRWIAARQVTPEQRNRALRAVEPEVMALVSSVGAEHLRDLQNALKTIRRRVPSDIWENAIVVVSGGPAPRRDNLETAAAISVFGRKALGRRIFYAENIFDTAGAFRLAASLEADKALSGAIFNDPHRMWRDLFSDVSRKAARGGFDPALAR